LLRPVGQSWALTSTNTYFRSKKRKEKKKNWTRACSHAAPLKGSLFGRQKKLKLIFCIS
jgi:hypothetical protein